MKIYYLLLSCLMALATAAQSIKVNSKRLDHNVVENGVKGLKVHLDFELIDMNGAEGEVLVYLEQPKGVPVKDLNGSYLTVNGNVVFSSNYHSPYDNSRYEDFTVFMPLDELHMNPGTNTYYCKVKFYDTVNKQFMDNVVYLTFEGTTHEKVRNENHHAQEERVNRTNLPGGGYQEYISHADGSMTMNTYLPCSFCRGTKQCQGCFGAGGRWIYGRYFPCTLCGGTNVCHACKGKGGTLTSVLIKENSAEGHDSNGGYYKSEGDAAVYYDSNGRAFISEGNGGSSGGNSSSGNNSSSSSRYGNISCHLCNGSGVCSTCNGKGYTNSMYTGGTMSCPNCHPDHIGKCSKCGGSGKVYGLR